MLPAISLLLALAPVQFEGETTFDALHKAAYEADISYKPMPERMEFFARRLLGKPYVGWTLERDENQEFCFVSMDRLDCVTFAETVLGLANVRWNSRALVSSDNLVRAVEETRYRGGRVDGYLSRLHYTSDWIYDNARKGTVIDLTKSLPGAKPFVKTINFMSQHMSVYRQLIAHP